LLIEPCVVSHQDSSCAANPINDDIKNDLVSLLASSMPFKVSFLSDQYEFAAVEAGVGILGFKLKYYQTAC
jgi:hypothetical protein